MAIPILHFWDKYFTDRDEGLGSTYERFIINEVLFKTIKHYRINTAIETPCFGFTGLSGINSIALAQTGVNVTINDDNPERLSKIEQVWAELDVAGHFDYTEDFSKLPYKDGSFDMAWNFSALWFVADLDSYLVELSRITTKVIVFMVPNTTGLGYIHQKYTGQDDLKHYLREDNIRPKHFVSRLNKLGWKLMNYDFIDCPLWPDIGMSKEDFLKKIKLHNLYKKFTKKHSDTKKTDTTIVNYYNNTDLDLKKNMLKYDFFERYLPDIFKKFWAHHKYYIFLRTK